MTPRQAVDQVLAESPALVTRAVQSPHDVVGWVTGAAWAVLQKAGLAVDLDVADQTRVAAREAVEAAVRKVTS